MFFNFELKIKKKTVENIFLCLMKIKIATQCEREEKKTKLLFNCTINKIFFCKFTTIKNES